MLYEYDGKIYVKPLTNKMSEVKISKEGKDGYDVKPVGKMVYIDEKTKGSLKPVTVEQAFNIQKGSKETSKENYNNSFKTTL